MADSVQDHMVVKLDYTLMIEGEIMESTADGEPIEFIQGTGQIIPGLEDALYGMKVGEKKTIEIQPEKAYGIYDPDSQEAAKKDEFSEEIPLDVGTFLDLRDDEGEVLSAQIIAADEDTGKGSDFRNHNFRPQASHSRRAGSRARALEMNFL